MNYLGLKTAVQDYLEVDETTFNLYFDTFLKNAESDILRQVQMPFSTEVTTSGTIAPNTNLYTVPDDFLSPYHFGVIGDDGARTLLLMKDMSFMRELTYPVETTGTPRFYCIYDATQIMVWPKVSALTTVELSYFKVPVSLTVQQTGTWLSEKAEHALLFGTVLQGYIFLKGDQDVIARYTEQYQSALASLKVITEGRQLRDTYRSPERRVPS